MGLAEQPVLMRCILEMHAEAKIPEMGLKHGCIVEGTLRSDESQEVPYYRPLCLR